MNGMDDFHVTYMVKNGIDIYIYIDIYIDILIYWDIEILIYWWY